MAQGRTLSGSRGGRGTAAIVAVLLLLGAGVLAGVCRALLIVPLHVSLDPNEGWNAYHATAAMAGNPYPPAGGFFTNNYPPLSFYLVGVVGSWCGDNVVAGRLISLTAFGTLCLFTALALRRMGAHWSAALFSPLLLAATLLLASDYVGMDDPQLLGHAIQFAGLLLLLGPSHRTTTIVASAALFVAGAFVKHNLVALPLASAAWLLLVDRHQGVRFAVALLTLTLATFIATDALLAQNLLRTLNSPRTFSAGLLAGNLRGWLAMMAFQMAGLLWLLVRFADDRSVWLASLYVAIAFVSGGVFLGGAGVDVNAMFDADIALALCTGLAVSRSLDGDTAISRTVAQLIAMLCMVPFALTALRSPDWHVSSFWLRPLREDAATAGRDITYLRRLSGPAICEDLALCYWAGKSAAVDVFNLDQEIETGMRDPRPFLQLIQSHYFAVIELDETSPFPFPRDVEEAIQRNYRVDHEDDEGIFFLPRR